jgi:glycosyl transferase family 25
MSAPLHFPGLMVLLINLERSTQRRIQMEARLREAGLSYQILPAVDGAAEQAQLRHTVDAPAFRWHTGRDALPGEVGCYHSHLQAWQKLIESTHDTLLVLPFGQGGTGNRYSAVSQLLPFLEQQNLLH